MVGKKVAKWLLNGWEEGGKVVAEWLGRWLLSGAKWLGRRLLSDF